MHAAFDPRNRSGWIVVAGLLLVTIVIHGTITSALPTFDEALLKELGIARASLKLRETIFLLSSGLSGLAIGYLIQKVAPRFVVLAGLVLLALALWLYSRATSISQLYALYALFGPCYASAHVVIVVVLMREYFASHRTLATSVALSGTSLGSAALPSLAVYLNQTYGWRTSLEMLLWLPLALVPVVAALLFRSAPVLSAPSESTSISGIGLPAAASARRSPLNLALLAVATFGVFFAATAILLNLFLYLRDLQLSPQIAAAGLSVVFAVGLVSKVLVGAAAERWGVLTVWNQQQTVLLVGAGLLISAWPPLIVPALALIGLGWAGCFVLTQVVIADYFAGPQLSKRVGFFIVFEALSSGSGVLTAAYLYDVTGSYRLAFTIACGAIGVAVLAGWMFRRSQCHANLTLVSSGDAKPVTQ